MLVKDTIVYFISEADTTHHMSTLALGGSTSEVFKLVHRILQNTAVSCQCCSCYQSFNLTKFNLRSWQNLLL